MTTTKTKRPRRRALSTVAVGLLGGVLIMVALLRQGAPIWSAVLGFAVLAGYATLLFVFQARNDTIGTLAGNPVDERWSLIHSRATELAATCAAVVAVGGYLVTEFAGRDNWQFALMAVVVGLSYLAGVIWFRRRL
jgi:hypothetical protein